LTTGCRQAAGSRRCARQTGQHCSSQNQSSRKKKNSSSSSSSSSSRNNNISNRQMTGMKKQKPPSERPRNERGGASARPLSAPPARGLFPARAAGSGKSARPVPAGRGTLTTGSVYAAPRQPAQ
ncbi:hypothetical protein, partial [Escherichia coli]